ncbi:MAG: response regulator [Treponema sp.]|jgi:signal transduction histidine kinase|nr:response regulator [Treponema sp.]
MINNTKKIIVVDDNIENLTAIKNSLKDIYDVFPIPSAVKMFELLKHIEPDLVLLDVRMPDMDGYEAARKLKNDGKSREIPVIFLTAMDDAESEIEGLNIGAVDYIHKPFVAQLLVQRIKTHLSLADHRLDARNASRARGEFLACMSHELRAPLNAITDMINIARNSDDIQEIKRGLKNADNASKHLTGITNDILDMSGIEAGKFELSYGEFDFRKMLTDVINTANFSAGEKKITLSINLNKNIPSFIISDELRLSRVIINLITSAIKFTPERGAVVLSAEKLDESDGCINLKIEVAGTGAGIPEEQQKQLFTPYSQADNGAAKNTGGTGLGLAVSKRIVDLMQGKIWTESGLNKGSKFIFTMKARKGTEKDVSRESGGSKELVI